MEGRTYDFKYSVNAIVKMRRTSKVVLAQRTGLSYYCLTTIDDGWSPTLGTVLLLCEALQVPLSTFLRFSCREVPGVGDAQAFDSHGALVAINGFIATQAGSSGATVLKWKSRFDRYCQVCAIVGCTPEEVAVRSAM